LLYLMGSFSLIAQKSVVDQQTLELFNAKNWMELIEVGEQAVERGEDFYYLNYRLGIAHYELKKYMRSIPYFRKAHIEDPSDQALLEYLYYAYLFSGDNNNAELYASKIDKLRKNVLGISSGVVRNLSLVSSYAMTNNLNTSDEMANYPITEVQSGVLNGGNLSAGIYAGYMPTKRCSIDIGGVFFKNESRVAAGRSVPVNVSNINTQGNLFVNYYLGKGLSMGIGLGYYLSNIPSFQMDNSSIPRKIIYISNSSSFYSVSGYIGCRIERFEPALLVSYSDLNGSRLLQVEPSVLFYPFGHYKFYGKTSVGIVPQSSERTGKVFSQKLGGSISKKLWTEANFAFGDMWGYITQYNFVAYNTYDQVKMLGSLDFNYYIKKVMITVGYSIQQREGYLRRFNQVQMTELDPKIYKYFLHGPKLNIKWYI